MTAVAVVWKGVEVAAGAVAGAVAGVVAGVTAGVTAGQKVYRTCTLWTRTALYKAGVLTFRYHFYTLLTGPIVRYFGAHQTCVLQEKIIVALRRKADIVRAMNSEDAVRFETDLRNRCELRNKAAKHKAELYDLYTKMNNVRADNSCSSLMTEMQDAATALLKAWNASQRELQQMDVNRHLAVFSELEHTFKQIIVEIAAPDEVVFSGFLSS